MICCLCCHSSALKLSSLLIHRKKPLWSFHNQLRGKKTNRASGQSALSWTCRDFSLFPRTLQQTRHSLWCWLSWALDPLHVAWHIKDHAVSKEILHRGPYPDGHPAQPVWNESWCGTGALPASLLAQHDPGSHLGIDPDAVPQPPQPPGGWSQPASQECGPGWVLHSTEAAGLGPLSGQTTGRKSCPSPYLSIWSEGMEL